MSGKRRSLAELASASSVATPTQSATVVATPVATEASPPVEETAQRSAAAPVATPAAAVPRPATRGRATSTRGHAGGRRSPATATRPARFDEFERKEARLRADQYEALTTLSRQLNRVRGGQGQRITENTLIRVAVDLLLASDNLTGVTEDALRKSVTS